MRYDNVRSAQKLFSILDRNYWAIGIELFTWRVGHFFNSNFEQIYPDLNSEQLCILTNIFFYRRSIFKNFFFNYNNDISLNDQYLEFQKFTACILKVGPLLCRQCGLKFRRKSLFFSNLISLKNIEIKKITLFWSVSIFFGIFFGLLPGSCRSIPAKPTGIKKEKDIPRLPEN